MKILAFLQNQWFKDPERVQAFYDEHPERRNQYIARFLFLGCLTGRRLKAVLGEDLCNQIIWEEASPKVGGHSGSAFAADPDHIHASIVKHQPDVILCFGKIAGDAVRSLRPKVPVHYAPHPAARQNPMPELRALAVSIRRLTA